MDPGDAFDRSTLKHPLENGREGVELFYRRPTGEFSVYCVASSVPIQKVPLSNVLCGSDDKDLWLGYNFRG